MKGDVVHIVLDCLRVARPTGTGYQIRVRGVFTDAADAPPPLDGATRNIVGAFLDITTDGEPGAFWIPDSDGTPK